MCPSLHNDFGAAGHTRGKRDASWVGCWSERFDHAHDAVTCRPNEDVSPRRQMRLLASGLHQSGMRRAVAAFMRKVRLYV